MSPENLLVLDFKKLCKGANKYEEVQIFLQKLKFFHTWLFYYFYSADQKFIKNILKSQFKFTKQLFGPELARIYSSPLFKRNLRKIYCPRLEDYLFKKKYE